MYAIILLDGKILTILQTSLQWLREKCQK